MTEKSQRAVRKKKRKNAGSGYYDYSLLSVVIILITFGLIMLYSASSYEATYSIGNDMYYFRHQAIITLGAVAFGLFISTRNYRTFIRLAPLFYVLALLLMLAVQTPLGYTAGGARRWINLGFATFQPAEVAKIAVILFMPYAILRMGRNVATFKGVLTLLLLGGIQAAAAWKLTENLSTAIIIFGIVVVVTFLSHPKTLPWLVLIAGLTIIVLLFLYYLKNNLTNSENFRIRRILAWLQPENSDLTEADQLLEGLYAIGSGGFFGKGLGNSTQKLSAIPEAQNDMIFSIICEELGLFGAIIVLVLFAYLLYRLFFIARNAKDLYGTLMVSGIFTHVAIQVIGNVSVVLGIIPTTGITLPFVSFGGTSVIFLMFEIGLALSASRFIPFEGEEHAGAEGKKHGRAIPEQ